MLSIRPVGYKLRKIEKADVDSGSVIPESTFKADAGPARDRCRLHKSVFLHQWDCRARSTSAKSPGRLIELASTACAHLQAGHNLVNWSELDKVMSDTPRLSCAAAHAIVRNFIPAPEPASIGLA